MNWILEHLRNKLLAGGFAIIPIALVVYIALWIEENTKALTTPLGFHYPGLGFVLALAILYTLGVAVTTSSSIKDSPWRIIFLNP